MTSVNIYLNFNGNCEEAFTFYKSVFGGEFSYVGRFKDMPPSEEGGKMLSPEEGNRIMHISLPISGETVLMGSDIGGDWAPTFLQGNNFAVSVNTDSRDEADRLFNGLAENGHPSMPMSQTFWGDYFGMLTDQYGVNWMISYNAGQQQQ